MIINWHLQSIFPPGAGFEWETIEPSRTFHTEVQTARDKLTPAEVKSGWSHPPRPAAPGLTLLLHTRECDVEPGRGHTLARITLDPREGASRASVFVLCYFSFSCWDHRILRVWAFLVWWRKDPCRVALNDKVSMLPRSLSRPTWWRRTSWTACSARQWQWPCGQRVRTRTWAAAEGRWGQTLACRRCRRGGPRGTCAYPIAAERSPGRRWARQVASAQRHPTVVNNEESGKLGYGRRQREKPFLLSWFLLNY